MIYIPIFVNIVLLLLFDYIHLSFSLLSIHPSGKFNSIIDRRKINKSLLK